MSVEMKEFTMHPFSLFIVIVLTLTAGFADAQGFLYSTAVWQQGVFNWSAAWRSAIGFSLSVPCYWIAVRYLHEGGIITPEIQALFWFVVTITGVALPAATFSAGISSTKWSPSQFSVVSSGSWFVPVHSVAVHVLVGPTWSICRSSAISRVAEAGCVVYVQIIENC